MINLIRGGTTPLYQQIYEQLRRRICSGATAAGSKLPPIRTLATDLQVSRNTVEAAYTQLAQKGFVAARAGSGYTVQDIEPVLQGNSEYREATLGDFEQYFAYSAPCHEEYSSLDSAKDAEGRCFDFTDGNLLGKSFPAYIWRKLTNKILSDPDLATAAAYPDPLGERNLREQISHYLQVYRGVNCHPAQVVIQPGTQGSLYNLLTLFDPLHDVVAMGEPGYDGARVVFENRRFRLYPIPMVVRERELNDAYYASQAKLAYVIPSNQFPTGRELQLTARQALLNWARGTNAYLIEDDYYCEHRYTVRPLPALQSLDRHNRVIYMGTFSKALSPSLRMSYLVLPPDLLDEWSKVFADHCPEVPWLNQSVLEAYMRLGYWEKHMRKMQAANKRKYSLLRSSLVRLMGDQIKIIENGSGLHLFIGTRDGREQAELIECASAHNVKVQGTNKYWMTEKHPPESYILVGFSAIEEERIVQGVERLAQAWFA